MMLEAVFPLFENLLDQADTLLWRADLAYGTVAGAVAIVINARIALLAPLLVAALEVSRLYDVDLHPALIEAIPSLAVIFVVLGCVQALVTAFAGRDAAAALIGVVVGGLVLFALWRGPMRVLRLLSRGRL